MTQERISYVLGCHDPQGIATEFEASLEPNERLGPQVKEQEPLLEVERRQGALPLFCGLRG